MAEESRRRRQRRELIAEILNVARTQLAAGGPGSVSFRAIARSVGLSAPSLYSYFPSLADLFTELIVQSYESLAHAVNAAVEQARSESLEERLLAGPRAYRRWALDNRQAFNLIFFDQITGYQAPVDGPTVAAQIAVLRPIANEFAIAAGLKPGALSSPSDDLDSFLGWWGAFHGLVALEANHHLSWVDSEAVFERRLRLDIAQIQADGRRRNGRHTDC